MEKDIDKTEGETSPGGGRGDVLGLLILRTAAISAAVFIAAAALVMSLIGCFAPRAYMEMYRSLGAYGMAAMYADEALDRAHHAEDCADGGCDYITLAGSAAEIAGVAYSESGSQRHAVYLYNACSAYLGAGCHSAHSDLMDAYYSDVYSDRPELLCTVYGYDAYVFGERVTAMCGMSGVSYDGSLGEGYADCTTFGDALTVHVGRLTGMLTGGEDVFYALEGLTSFASASSDVSVLGDGAAVLEAFNVLSALAREQENGFAKAYIQYKLYRLAYAFCTAESDAGLDANWTDALASSAYSEYSDTVNAIKNDK